MLSILVPVYNFNSRPLLERLHSQAEALNIEYEIIVADDASTLFRDEIAGIAALLFLTAKLLSSHPSLLYLDVYKLLYIAQSTN